MDYIVLETANLRGGGFHENALSSVLFILPIGEGVLFLKSTFESIPIRRQSRFMAVRGT